MANLSARSESPPLTHIVKAYVELLKPRITALLVFTALCGAMVARGAFLDPWSLLVIVIGLSAAAGGAAAVNMWYDRDTDAIMERTVNRPIPAGTVPPSTALVLGILLQIFALVWFWVHTNGWTVVLTLVGYLYYAVVYTMWLKRKTVHNIVIGGGAGAVPPLIGWAAVTGSLDWTAISMFMVIFCWTPSHFWSLAIVKNEDYQRAGVPMMPVVRGVRETKRQSLIYMAVLALVSLVPFFTGAVGTFYLVAAILCNMGFCLAHVYLWLEDDDQTLWARRTFYASLLYLPLIFIAVAFDVIF